MRITNASKNDEPSFNGTTPITQSDIAIALYWYGENKTEDDARQYLIGYLKPWMTKPQLQVASGLRKDRHISTGWMARLISRGAALDALTRERFEVRCKGFLMELDAFADRTGVFSPEDETDIKKPSIQERVESSADRFIMDLEGLFDTLWHKKLTPIEEFDPYSWMVDQGVKGPHARHIAKYFGGRAEEFNDAVESYNKDSYVKESFGNRSKKDLQQAAEFFTGIVESANKLYDNKLATRKPRKKKAKSPEKIVGKMKFKDSDTSLQIQSINPAKIVGANQLWVFNVKTRKLGCYIAADAAGLSMKGSTVQNYKYSESVSKTLRKPKEILKKVTEGGKVSLRRVLPDIKAKASELNGRINKDVVLLRVE